MFVVPRRAQTLLALGLVLTLGCTLLFMRLGMGPLEVYDEGLYGMYGQNALHFKQWLHAVDENGAFPTGAAKFSKPPLVLWLVAGSFKALGPSLFALRLPFAVASLAIALICFGWGLKIGGPSRGLTLGLTWSVLWLTCHGTYHYGRTATIEPVLIAFVMLTLWAHANTLQRGGWAHALWALVGCLSLLLAFLTKQLVCVLAALPIAAVELSRFRSERFGNWFLRNTLILGVPTLGALAWIYVVWRKVGKAAQSVLWDHAVANRVAGYDGNHHQNYLNRVAVHLDLNATPFSWQLGLLGLSLCIASMWRKGKGREPDVWLLSGCLFVAWVAFDVGSQSILPWYAMTLLPSLAFGNAWLISHAVDAVRGRATTDTFERVAAGAGAAALLWLAAAAARDLMPSVLAAALCALLVTLCVARAPLGAWSVVGAALATLALMLAGSFARPAYAYSEPDALSKLGVALNGLRAKHVILDSRVKTHGYVRRTFLGSQSDSGVAPWKLHRKQDKPADAFVELRALPLEVSAARGIRLVRSAGSYAAFGKVWRAPFERKDLEATLLAKGKLTFEAEDLASERFDSLRSDASASGGKVRRLRRSEWDKTSKAALINSSTIEVPAGEYDATFWIALTCDGVKKDVLGVIGIAFAQGADTNLRCDKKVAPKSGRYLPFKVPVSLRSPMPLQITITHKQGEIAFDRMVLTPRAKASK